MSHLSDFQLDQGLMRGAEPDHVATCERCRRRWEELARDREAFAERARPAAFAEAVLARARPRRGWWLWALAPAAIVLALILWPKDGERFKGKVAVEMYVRSDGRTDRFDAQRRYHTGDALQLVYSAGQPYYFMAVEVEAGGRATLLQRDEAPLPAGSRRRVDRSFVLDEAAGDERIHLLFSERPLDPERVLQAAREAAGERLALPVAAQTSFLIRR